MIAEIKFASDSVEFLSEERCYISEIANDAGDSTVSIAKARVIPGVTTKWHRLNGIVERYIITSGQGVVEIGNLAAIKVSENDVVRIPSNVLQRITNTGTEDLVFFCVCTPPFNYDNYESLE